MRVAAGDNEADFDFRLEALTRDDVSDLAAGLVPHTLRAQALSLLDYEDHIRRNSAKPIQSGRVARRRGAAIPPTGSTA
jgi:hypothetical protein